MTPVVTGNLPFGADDIAEPVRYVELRPRLRQGT